MYNCFDRGPDDDFNLVLDGMTIGLEDYDFDDEDDDDGYDGDGDDD